MADDVVFGLDGPVVMLEARVAALLARPLQRLVTDACRRGETVEPCVLAAVRGLERVRRVLAIRASSDSGTARNPNSGGHQ